MTLARTLRAAATAVALAGAALLVAGCAAPATQPQIRTASDMTDADRSARLRLELASGYFANGQTTTALDEVKQALQARPDLPEAFNLRGLIYAALGQPELADESFRRALQLNPRDPDAMHNYGWFLCQSGQHAAAAEQFDRALAQPQYRQPARTMLARGVCEARAGRDAEAERHLSRAYELEPGNPAIAYSLGELLFRKGDLERARFYLRRLNAQPATTNAQSLWLAARIEHRLGNAAGVRALGDQLRERFPQSPEALQFDRGRFDG